MAAGVSCLPEARASNSSGRFNGDSFKRYADEPRAEKVWNVEFEGNRTFTRIVLNNVIATEEPSFWRKISFIWKRSGYDYDPIEIKKDVIRLQRFYQRRGFHKVEVKSSVTTGKKPWRKKVKFVIDEGNPIMIRRVDYVCAADAATESYILESSEIEKTRDEQPYQAGKRYEVVRQPEVKGAFVRALKNLGYAYAGVDIKADVDSALNSAYLQLRIDPGPRTYIDTIRVEGNKVMSDHFVRRQSGLKAGNPYSIKKLEEAQRLIYNHQMFRFATISTPKQPRDSTLNLLIRVRESELHSVQLQAGVGREEKVRGQVTWTHRNAFNAGHRFSTSARASFIEQRVNIDYLVPYVFNPKSNIVVTPFGQHLLEPSYELYRLGLNNSFIYQYSQHLTGSVTYQLTRNFELSRRSYVDLPDTTRAYNISALQFSGYYREGFLGQQDGWVIQPFIELSGLAGSASYRFQKFSVDVRRYTPITSKLTLATRVHGGAIFSTERDSLPSNIRFYVGGTNTVRGWGRQMLGPKRPIFNKDGSFSEYVPLGGRMMLNFNVELRKRLDWLIKGIGMTAFLDGGQVWRDVSRAGRRPIQFGVGGGLRYRSPIGPVRVDIGYKLNPTAEDLNKYGGVNYGSRWNRFSLHFSIGQAF